MSEGSEVLMKFIKRRVGEAKESSGNPYWQFNFGGRSLSESECTKSEQVEHAIDKHVGAFFEYKIEKGRVKSRQTTLR
jgi:hypothetical protein